MVKIKYLKDLYEVEGKSLNAIADEMGLNWRTVKKYAEKTDWNQPKEPTMSTAQFPVLGEFIPTIDEWLIADENEPRKQRHTAKRVYERLQKEKSYAGSYSSVKRYVRRKHEQMHKYKESFLPLAHPLGSSQTDFGDFKYYDGLGNPREGHALILSFPNANTGWIQVFPSENQECLLEGLKRIFYHIGGVPPKTKCDNMTTAVAQILEGTERVITDGFYRFMLHHRFDAEFCTPAKGNEKGNVENKVGYTRRNMLVPVPTITDFEAFNAELLRRCDEDHEREHYVRGERISELWAEEKNHLLTLPEYEYEVFRYDSLRVSKGGFIAVEPAKYSLSPEFSGKTVQAKIYFDKIEVFYERSLLKTFQRSYSKNEEILDWKAFVPALVKKPGATEHTRFFGQMPKLWQEYLKSVRGSERKSALTLLSEIVADGNDAFCDDVIEMAREYGNLSIDSIRQCYVWCSKPERHPKPLKLLSTPPPLNYQPDLTVYDDLTVQTRTETSAEPLKGGVSLPDVTAQPSSSPLDDWGGDSL